MHKIKRKTSLIACLVTRNQYATRLSPTLASFVSYIVIHDYKSRRFIRDRIRTARATGPEETAASSRGKASMGRGTDGPTELGEVGQERVVCKRGLTRDACLGEAITRRSAGAALERGTTLALPPYPPLPLPRLSPHRDPPSRTTVPTSPFPDNPLNTCTQVPPPVASSRLDDSTCQPAPPTPPCRGPPFLSLSLSASSISIGSISLASFYCAVRKKKA